MTKQFHNCELKTLKGISISILTVLDYFKASFKWIISSSEAHRCTINEGKTVHITFTVLL